MISKPNCGKEGFVKNIKTSRHSSMLLNIRKMSEAGSILFLLKLSLSIVFPRLSPAMVTNGVSRLISEVYG